MATRSTVGVIQPDGSVKSIYVHWDGSPKGVGQILVTHYREITKIDELLNLGDLSLLGPDIGVKHEFEDDKNEMCLAFGRDRGETDVDAVVFDSQEHWLKTYGSCEYAYLFQDTKWITYTRMYRYKKEETYPFKMMCWWEDDAGKQIGPKVSL